MVSSSISDASISERDRNLRESTRSSVTSIRSDVIPPINDQYTFPEKMATGIQWMINPVRRICRPRKSNEKTHLSKAPMSLKPRLDRVNGLLKYFTFGVMFTNGMFVCSTLTVALGETL